MAFRNGTVGSMDDLDDLARIAALNETNRNQKSSSWPKPDARSKASFSEKQVIGIREVGEVTMQGAQAYRGGIMRGTIRRAFLAHSTLGRPQVSGMAHRAWM